MFIFLPANCWWSVDAWMNPKIKKETIPYWPIWLLRTFMGIVYFYAGVAKMNVDWLHGEPLLHWLPKRGFQFSSQYNDMISKATLYWIPYGTALGCFLF